MKNAWSISFSSGAVVTAYSNNINDLKVECLNRCENMQQEANILDYFSFKVVATVKRLNNVFMWEIVQ